MGKGASTTQTSNSNEAFNQLSSYDIPPEVKAAWTRALSMAGQAADQPFQAYQGVPVAPFAPDTLEGYQSLRNIAEADQPLNQAAQESALSLLAQAGQAPSQADIQQYMNPYQENVSDIAMQRLSEQYEQQRQRLAGQKALAGAFGGSRFGVQEGQLAGENQRQKMELLYGGLQDNYDRALAAQQQGLGQQSAAIGTGMTLSDMLRDQQVANASNLTTIGQDFQQQAQGGLDFGVGEFGRGVQYPFDVSQFYSDQAYAYPWQSSPQQTSGTTSSTTTGTATETPSFLSQLGQVMGIAKTGLGFFKDGGGVSNPLNQVAQNYREGGKVMRRNYQDGGGIWSDKDWQREEEAEARANEYIPEPTLDREESEQALRLLARDAMGDFRTRSFDDYLRQRGFSEDAIEEIAYNVGETGMLQELRESNATEDDYFNTFAYDRGIGGELGLGYSSRGPVLPRNYQDGGGIWSDKDWQREEEAEARANEYIPEPTLGRRDQERQRQLEDLYYKWVSGGRGPETQAEIERLHEQLRETRPLMIYEAWENVTGNVLDNTWGPQPSWEEHFGNDTRREYADGGEVRPQATENLYAPWGRSSLMEMLSKKGRY